MGSRQSVAQFVPMVCQTSRFALSCAKPLNLSADIEILRNVFIRFIAEDELSTLAVVTGKVVFWFLPCGCWKMLANESLNESFSGSRKITQNFTVFGPSRTG